MDNNIEERLVEEFRRYEHLYNQSTSTYKDAQMTANSRSEISAAFGLDVQECIQRWRRIRDRFVRVKNTTEGSSDDAEGQKYPAFFISRSWLLPHIKHSETTSNYDNKQPEPSCPESSVSESESSPESSTSESESSPRVLAAYPPASMLTPCRRSQKRRRRMEQDRSYITEVFSKLEESRQQLYRTFVAVAPRPSPEDEFSCWGQYMGVMAKNLPKDKQQELMFQVWKLMHFNQPDEGPCVSSYHS
ncbi:uncharacterized protein LOC133958731 [Platichthys flesus]|uniref:uncharacterized protein LOC133958731 n=1 Tax=Platichthys flesus TaxID=8260 RepID=UPI002DB5C485|nr:uncharacterized protein LOC133958731 [Platichthys flesus]